MTPGTERATTMFSRGTSGPVRLLCAVGAVLTAYAAVRVGLSPDWKMKTGEVIQLAMPVRVAMAGTLGVFSLIAGYVAITGRAH
jgi:hypothetical protein